MNLRDLTPVVWERIAAISIWIVTFVVYVLTLCPTVGFIDSGELAAVASTLGIAHPTGYPLFTLLAFAWSLLPLGLRTIHQLNLFAAFCCSTAAVVYFRYFLFVFSHQLIGTTNRPKSEKASRPERRYIDLAASAIGALTFAFSETYWSQALAVEVYSLHLVFLALILLCFSRAVQPPDSGPVRDARWYLFAFVLGLSFTNHLTTILLAPALIYAFFIQRTSRRRKMSLLGKMVLPFVIGLSVYAYLPVRAAAEPLLNWGDPGTVWSFFQHLGGKQYSVWLFSSAEIAARQFKYFFSGLPAEFAFLPLFIAAIGVWVLARFQRPAFLFSLLLFLGCVLYAINYDINDIDSYFLLAYGVIALWSAAGVRYLLTMGKRIHIIAGIFSAVLVLQVSQIWSRTDQRGLDLVENYTRDMFRSVDQDAIVLSYQWDYWISASYYFTLVENIRPDITVVDKELLRRTWYFRQLERQYPWLISKSKEAIDAYLVELNKFEHGLPYNANLIERRYAEVIRSFIVENLETRPVYVTPEIEGQYTAGFQRVPSGLAFRLYPDAGLHNLREPEFSIAPRESRNLYEDGIISLYARAHVNHALYFRLLGKKEETERQIEYALRIRPGMPEALTLKSEVR